MLRRLMLNRLQGDDFACHLNRARKVMALVISFGPSSTRRELELSASLRQLEGADLSPS